MRLCQRTLVHAALAFAALPGLMLELVPIAAAQSMDAPLAFARLGQTVRVDGPRVTPLAVREDSRCPRRVVCAWAGRVRVSVRVLTGRGARTMELTLGQPVTVTDGKLELAGVTPDRRADAPIAAGQYRFGFRFAGGY